MATEIQTKMKNLIVAVNDEQYYVTLFQGAMNEHGLTLEGVREDEYTDKQIVYAVQEFWDALPDSPSIRREPFFLVCDIAENIYDV